MTLSKAQPTVLIIIPCLNEAMHIESLLDTLRPSAERLSAYIAVMDGGSSDGTPAIVARYAKHHPCVVLLQNSKRLQSAAINHVVNTFGLLYPSRRARKIPGRLLRHAGRGSARYRSGFRGRLNGYRRFRTDPVGYSSCAELEAWDRGCEA